MTQWAAAIRLALYEHSSLLEAYTGCIIAGKGKSLNNIRDIMERTLSKYEDWVRVRFGAGTPWRRCWCVVNPPDPKQYQKMRKSMKKRSAYDRTTPLLTGNVKFYENKKTRKAKPIATITSAYAAYAIYPQSKELIDQSTLVKIEGDITTHGQTETTAEGMVFVMPEIHPAVSGFEMMLRFLFPVFDTFGLYGRPNRLIADTNNVKSLMFALPRQKRYGYLDVLDVANLIHTPGARDWDEKTWWKELKETTASRMAAPDSPASSGGRDRPRQGRKARTRFQEPGQGLPTAFNQSADTVVENSALASTASPGRSHSRMASEPASAGPGRATDQPSTPQFSSMEDAAMEPQSSPQAVPERPTTRESSGESSYGSGFRQSMAANADAVGHDLRPNSPPTPVAAPPEFAHSPRDTPPIRPQPSPELRMANHRMSMGTLLQLEEVGRMGRGGSASEQQRQEEPASSDQQRPQTGGSAGYAPYRSDVDERRPSIPSVGPPTPKRNSQGGLNLHIDTSKATKRKPVPSQDFQVPAPPQQPEEEAQPAPPAQPSAPTPESEPPSSTVSDNSIAYLRQTIDDATLERIMFRQPSLDRRPSPVTSLPPPKPTQQVDDESVYSKDPEPESPDYASSRPSVETERSEASLPRPRMGVLKTVGDAPPPGREVILGDTRYVAHDELPKENPDIPEIDFGPTMSYDPTTRRPSLGDINRISHNRSDSQSTVRQEKRHRRGSSREEQRRSMLWQPGLAMGRPESPASRAVSPEEFVHRRSNSQQMAIPPPYHQRTSSNSTVRPKSGDWAHLAHQYARDLPPRPHSRGAASVLSHQDLTSHLSAREQEHVARMTGSSFFNLSSSNTKQQPVGSGGLVAAIDAREREKRDFREGVSNQMVQQAIAQRQHHQQAAAMYEGYGHSQPGVAARPQSAFYSMPSASYTWDTVSNVNAYRPTTMAGVPPGWGGRATPPAAQQAPHYYQYPHQIN